MPQNNDARVTYFAETDARNKRVPFGIKSSDRSRHMYVIGKTGMGKSTLLENMAVQDIKNGEGMAFIDPHGKTAELLLDYVPQERIKDVLYFAPFDLEHPISFNVMEDVGLERRHLVANGLMSAFKKIWVDAWSARMEYILNNVLLALLEYPDATLIGVNRMLVDKEYRKKVVDNITDPSVKSFWIDEFAKYGDKYMMEAGAAIQNKIGQFISNPLVRNIIGQPKSTFDIRTMMDQGKIIIINLSKGRVGEANANLLGSMLITKIYLGAMSRADVSPGMLKTLPNFYLYVDEFQSFANESFADILSEARKYKLNLTVAHQYIEQMSDEVRAAVFGNVGTMSVFRVGAFDAEVLEKEFFPTFTKEDLVNLGFSQVYLKLMIDGVTSQPFSAVTLPPIEKPLVSFKEDIIRYSRTTFARPRSSVEEAIKLWHQQGQLQKGIDQGRGQLSDQSRSQDRNQDKRIQSDSKSDTRNDARSGTKPDFRPEIKSNNRQDERMFGRQDATQQRPSKPVSRETELRNAISLNYLRNTTPPENSEEKTPEKKKPQPRKEKNPSPENLSALRDALASVIQGAQGAMNDLSSDQDKKISENQSPQKQTAKQQEKPIEKPQVKTIEKQHNDSHKEHASSSNPKPHHTPEVSSSTVQSPNIEKNLREDITQRASQQNTFHSESEETVQSSTFKPREVPEDVLRKVLQVDKS